MKSIITISDFGPIDYAKIDLKYNFQVLIGEQASGKSTVCKVIYFCQKIRDYTLEYLSDSKQFSQNHENEFFNNYLKYLTKQFMGCFGTTKHMRKFEITYFFANKEISIILNDDGFVRFVLDRSLKRDLIQLINESASFYQEQISQSMDFWDYLKMVDMFQRHMYEKLESIFCNDAEVYYIPAGRSILATMSEQFQEISVKDLDLTMQDFIKLIRLTKNQFGTKIPEMVKNYTKTVKGQINNSAIEEAYRLIKAILKADYISDSEGEKMYFDEDQWVKLMFSSSGQQEALWILMLTFSIILERKNTFIIIEEPEAHLFPMAQKNKDSLISLMVNVCNCKCIITTHSPYILTSANLLLYSSVIESKQHKEVLVPKNERISFRDFNAFYVGKKDDKASYMTTLMDEETHMISLDYIDSVSNILNDGIVRLMNMED